MRIALNSTEDLIALLVRRKWWVAAPFLALTGLVAILTYVLPKTYVSEVLILVRPRDVPEDFVKDVIVTTPEQRMKSIEQTLLSRTNLVRILREFAESLPEFEDLNMDERVLKLRDQITIYFELEKTNSRNGPAPTYFRMNYRNQNPELAQRIASRLTALFIEQDNRSRENQVFGTTEFLSTELSKVSDELKESEEKLKQVKSSRLYELPDQRDANLRTLDRLVLDKKTNSEALDRYATVLMSLETQLSQTPETVPRTGPAPHAVEALAVEEYRKTKLEYEELVAKYKEKHPEVQALKARLERLKAQIPPQVLNTAGDDHSTAEAGTETSTATDPNPLYERLSGQLEQAKSEIDIRQKEKLWIESQIAGYSRRVENAPNAEQAIVEVVRQNEDLKKQYEGLKGSLEEARLAESLESKQKGSQFVVVDPANYPQLPDKPNKLAVLLTGTGISLLISILGAIAVDVATQKIWVPSQIEAVWGLPVLVDIPSIVTDADLAVQRRRKLLYAASSTAGVIVWISGLFAFYLKHDFILRQLDPIIQRVIYR
jgi:polysaccharide chain length determinant protein (PEP-CTERM system associated)